MCTVRARTSDLNCAPDDRNRGIDGNPGTHGNTHTYRNLCPDCYSYTDDRAFAYDYGNANL